MDTKEDIFNTALRLFSENGYEKVTVRDIANAVGIKAASIYNHYEGKEKILQSCYDFYLENRYLERLERDRYEPIIRNGTKEDIMGVINYSYSSAIYENMVYAIFIIYSRIYTDARAKEIYVTEMNDAMQYQEEVFKFGIKIGRIGKFDIPTVSLIILSARLFAGQSASIRPEGKTAWNKTRGDVFEELIKMVPFKY